MREKVELPIFQHQMPWRPVAHKEYDGACFTVFLDRDENTIADGGKYIGVYISRGFKLEGVVPYMKDLIAHMSMPQLLMGETYRLQLFDWQYSALSGGVIEQLIDETGFKMQAVGVRTKELVISLS